MLQFKKRHQLCILQIHTAYLDWPRKIMPCNIRHDTRAADQQSYQKILNKSQQSYRHNTRVGTLIVATTYLQLIQNRYMFRSFTVLQCSHQHCVPPVASDVEVVGYL